MDPEIVLQIWLVNVFLWQTENGELYEKYNGKSFNTETFGVKSYSKIVISDEGRRALSILESFTHRTDDIFTLEGGFILYFNIVKYWRLPKNVLFKTLWGY